MPNFLVLIILSVFNSCTSGQIAEEPPHLTRREVENVSKQLEAEVETRYPKIHHRLVNRYINSLGQTIISRNKERMPPLPYEFRVLRSEEIHAFSLPSGIIYITLGVLRHLDLEGQVAAVLTHELAHQAAGHSLLVWRQRLAVRGAYREYFASPLGTWEDRFVKKGGFLQYTKEMEKEADQVSLVLLYKANYDPRVVLSYLQDFAKTANRLPKETKAMRSLHPPIQDRISWTREQLTKLPPLKDPKLNSANFTEVKRHLREAEEKAKDRKK